jgi:hypothetical protein
MLALALVLVAPVAGPVERGFEFRRPFEAGHRGVDLAAAPGAPVRAACGGPVVFAGRIGASGGIVTLRCGAWRVTHMPLATISARGSVRRGAVIGTVAGSREHRGLHLGVRREGVRFGYENPLRFLADSSAPVPLGPGRRPARPRPPRAVPPPRVVRPPPRATARRLVRAPLRAAARRLVRAPLRATARRLVRAPLRAAARRLVRPPPASPPFAPWPAWAGLALVLGGAGLRFRVRRRVRTRSPAQRGGSVAA